MPKLIYINGKSLTLGYKMLYLYFIKQQQKPKAMKTVKNNEGKIVKVTSECYNEMMNDYNNGIWMDIIMDVFGNRHVVILPDNF